ncbi:RNA polymerase Rpb1, domain 7-domain-containing protein [Amanita rubescens]|nr:RNA polymerase Rpb1, domain 7-domain-containing protein [Amanita rubescens]
MYLEPEIAGSSALAKNVQQELAYTSLRAATAAVEIRYDPDPTSTIIEEDQVFVESFFAIPNEEIESKLLLQDRAKVIGRKLMHYVASRIAKSFKTDLFVIWSEDNSEKPIIRCQDDGLGTIEDIFLRQLENTMLNSVSLRGVKGIKRVFLTERDKVMVAPDGCIRTDYEKERVPETDCVNLKIVMCVEGVDFR